MLDKETRILRACEDILAKGRRPSVRSVAALLTKRYGSAPRYNTIIPILRDWKLSRAESQLVDRAVNAYRALDAEQRLAFRRAVGLP